MDRGGVAGDAGGASRSWAASWLPCAFLLLPPPLCEQGVFRTGFLEEVMSEPWERWGSPLNGGIKWS